MALPMLNPPSYLPRTGQSLRPALTTLALIAAANPDVRDSLMRDPVTAAQAHPHYQVALDQGDREILTAIRAHVETFEEFLHCLADVVDGHHID